MRELTADTFHQAMADNARIACILHRGSLDGAITDVAQTDNGSRPFAWAHIDLDVAPMIAAMFGVEGDAPWLLVMREAVVLYFSPLEQAANIQAILDGAARMDMDQVRRKVAEDRIGRDSLFNRRACPTTWRTR